ncbi:MAG: helix-turn-helix transcriptional regulator [Clostridiales bacterium]|nr:helix-turn-helix transcriptional regulator [Clostridiales bacterium]
MKEKHMNFGEYIKKKRLADPRNLTLQDIAAQLGISISYASAVENRTKHPYDGEMLKRLAEFLNLTDEDSALMYDIVGRETHCIPYDIEDTFSHENIGDLARYAIRLSQTGVILEEDWKAFIKQMEERGEGSL